MFLNNSSLFDRIKSCNGIEALIFDMDGTLVDTLPAHYEAWIKACEEFNACFSMDYFRKLTGRPTLELGKDIVEAFQIPLDPQTLVDRKNAMVNEQIDKMVVFPQIKDVLDHYRGQLPMAVGTGSKKDMADRILSATQLTTYFDIIVTSDDVSNYKPHPETFLKSAEHMGVTPSKCLVFEDGELGLRAAKDAGMNVVDVTEFY